jgi:hypothetical protein
MHVTIPITVKTQSDYLQEQYGLDFNIRTVVANDNQQPTLKKTVGLNVFSETNDTRNVINNVAKETNNFVSTYLDIGGQINKLFFPDTNPDQTFNYYGNDSTIKYRIDGESVYDNLIKYSTSNFTDGYNPLLLPRLESKQEGNRIL